MTNLRHPVGWREWEQEVTDDGSTPGEEGGGTGEGEAEG